MQSGKVKEQQSDGKLSDPAFPLEEKRVLLDGLEISYTIGGKGKPILILHGWGGSASSWEKVQKRLAARGYYVICPDLPGFGRSADPPIPWGIGDYTSFLSDFIEKIGLDGFFLLGHSLGGGLATRFTAEHPRKVRALILCDAAVGTNRNNVNLRQKIAYVLTKGGHTFFTIPIFKKMLYPPVKRVLGMITGIHDYYLPRGTMKGSFEIIIREDLSAFAPQVKVPTLIIWGRKDRTLPVKAGFVLKGLIANSLCTMAVRKFSIIL